MEAVVMGIVVCSAPLVLLGLMAGWRWRLAAAVVIAVGGLSAGVGLGVLGFSDLWVVPTGVEMDDALILIVMWCIFGSIARTAGPLSIPGPPWLMAMVMGATLGEVPAAAILSAGASTPKGAARLALAAAGGGMVGRMGDPALLILAAGHPLVMACLAPLGILCALLARPRSEDVVQPEAANTVRTWLVAVVALAAMVPGATVWALLVGIVGLSVMAGDRRGHVDLVTPAWQLIGVLMALLAIVGGLAEQIATGLEMVAELAGWMGLPALTAIAALCTAMSDSTAMAVLNSGLLDRAVSLRSDDLRIALTAGVAVGGLAPLFAAGSVRAGLRLWLAQILLAIVWVGVWACL
jgi:hypothetical protein